MLRYGSNWQIDWMIVSLYQLYQWQLSQALTSELTLAACSMKLKSKLIFFSPMQSAAAMIQVIGQCDANKENTWSVKFSL